MFSTPGMNAKAALLFAAMLIASPVAAATRGKAPAPEKKSKVSTTTAHGSKSTHKQGASSSHAKASHSSQPAAQHSAHKGGGKAGASKSVAAKGCTPSRKGKGKAVACAKPKPRGQQAIDNERTTQIQEALIREHYMEGEPSGEWDQATRDALMRLQGDNHWQTKVLPDSRALIKLGLGPSPQNLLNPESAAIAPLPQPAEEKPASSTN